MMGVAITVTPVSSCQLDWEFSHPDKEKTMSKGQDSKKATKKAPAKTKKEKKADKKTKKAEKKREVWTTIERPYLGTDSSFASA